MVDKLIWHEPSDVPQVRFEVERLGRHTVMRYQVRQKLFLFSWWRVYAETSTKHRPIEGDQFLRDWLDESKTVLTARAQRFRMAREWTGVL